jgi:hypothetical protein
MNSAAAGIDDAKNVSVLHPLFSPDFYKQAMEARAPVVQIGKTQYNALQRIDDSKTGFDAASYINPETGHAVLVFRGTNFPWPRQGASFSAFWKDFKAVMANNLGLGSKQLSQADHAYLDLMKNPDVKSVELVGYSLGTFYVNYLSAKYGARGTTIADLGLSGNMLRSMFNEKALDGVYDRLRDRTVNLVLKDDLIVRMFSASPHMGRQIDLDTHQVSDYAATIHFVDVYLDKVRDRNGMSAPAMAPAMVPA